MAMRTHPHWLLFAILLAAFGGCGARSSDLVEKALPGDYREILEEGEKFELLTLAAEGDELPAGAEVRETYEGCRIIDTREIGDDEAREKLIGGFYDAVSSGTDGVGSTCFWPRHGIRATRGNDTVTVLVCFECRNFYVYPDGPKNKIGLDNLVPLRVLDEEAKRLGMFQTESRR